MGYLALTIVGLIIFGLGAVLGAGTVLTFTRGNWRPTPPAAEPFDHEDHFGVR